MPRKRVRQIIVDNVIEPENVLADGTVRRIIGDVIVSAAGEGPVNEIWQREDVEQLLHVGINLADRNPFIG
jgi:hypothetical protein